MQSDLFYCKVTLHVSSAQMARWPGPNLAMFEKSSCTDIMICTGDCVYSF